MAANYENVAQPPTGMNYQPQVPDTTYGPMIHVYRPRFDPPGVGALPMISPAVGAQAGLTVSVHQQPAQMAMGPVFLPPMMGPQLPIIGGPLPMGPAIAVPAPIASTMGIASSGPQLIMQPPMAAAPMIMSGAPSMSMPMPMPIQQPMMAMPAGVSTIPGGQAMPMTPGMFVQGNGGVFPEPACGIGRTGTEYTAEQMEMAHANKSFEPQDFKPSDDSASRMYMCRELDGNWTMRSRFSIDRMNKEWRWHMAPEGYFYAVRLPN